VPATNYRELLAWLYALEARKGMDFKLERIELVLRDLGSPHRAYPVIHIAGTNGKGSVAAMLHAMALAAGLPAGLYTSPHLVRFTERIRVGDAEITPDEVVRLAAEVHRAATLKGVELTFFEFTTVLAFRYFADRSVPLAVVETGLGGRLDATNVVEPEVSVITSIGFDHQEFLGNTLAAIAGEKAGIIKRGRPVVVGPVPREAQEAIGRRAVEQQAPVWWSGQEFAWWGTEANWCFRGPGGTCAGVQLALRGRHQCENAAVAVAAAQALPDGLRWPSEAWRLGLENVRWPGRLEVVRQQPLVVLDGAHNIDGVRTLAETLPQLVGERRVHLLFAVMADKDWPEMIAALAPRIYDVVVTRPLPRRSADPREVAQEWGRFVPTVRIEEDPQRAIESVLACAAEDDAVLVAGSLFLVGAVRSVLCEGAREWKEDGADARAAP